MATEKRLIDANKIVMPLANYVVTNAYLNDSALDALKMVAKWIDEAPTVDAVEVVHGRWVQKAHYGAFGVFHLWHCSVCDTIRARQDPYCGQCGAKMDGDGNG